MTLEPSPPFASGTCPLCTTATTSVDARCPTCGYVLAGVDGRPPAFSRATLWLSAAGFGAVYLLTLAIVALTR